jgi:hypothetical protein
MRADKRSAAARSPGSFQRVPRFQHAGAVPAALKGALVRAAGRGCGRFRCRETAPTTKNTKPCDELSKCLIGRAIEVSRCLGPDGRNPPTHCSRCVSTKVTANVVMKVRALIRHVERLAASFFAKVASTAFISTLRTIKRRRFLATVTSMTSWLGGFAET